MAVKRAKSDVERLVDALRSWSELLESYRRRPDSKIARKLDALYHRIGRDVAKIQGQLVEKKTRKSRKA